MENINSNSNVATVNMAFAAGRTNREFIPHYYAGWAQCNIVAINPTMKELNDLFGREIVKDEPSYIGEEELNGKTVNTASIVIYVKPVEKYGVNLIQRLPTIKLYQTKFISKDGKTQFIDKFGVSAWPSDEEAAKKAKLLLSNKGTTYETQLDYDSARPAYRGEAALTDLLKIFMDIDNRYSMNQQDRTWFLNPNVKEEECEARLEEIKNYFKGNFEELKTIIAGQPTNKVKVCFGIYTNAENNKKTQTAYGTVLRPNATKYASVEKEINEANARVEARGGIVSTVYSMEDFHEVVETPSTFTAQGNVNPENDVLSNDTFDEDEDMFM